MGTREQVVEDGRRIVKPLRDPRHEAIGRAICALRGLEPDELVQGVTGAWWMTWDYAALHHGPKLQAILAAGGFGVAPLVATPAMTLAANKRVAICTPDGTWAIARDEAERTYAAMLAEAVPPEYREAKKVAG